MTTKPVNTRELVQGILMDVTQQNVYSHIALGNVLSKYQYLDKKERAFITRVVEGTLEHMLEIDYILNQFSKVKVNKMKPVIRNILRSAVYQMKYMDSVPDSAACNEAVKLTVRKGFQNLRGFVNGVLRAVQRGMDQVEYPKDPIQALSVRYSMPEWILKPWLAEYGQETTECILRDFQEEKPITIRCNLNRQTPDILKEKLEAQGVNVTKHPYLSYAFWISGYDYLGDLQSFQNGDFTVQDVSSMLESEVAAPQKGDYVIDVCAAPGGKALHIAEKLEGTGHVEARDLTPYKVEMIEENIRRMQAENISAVCRDATVPDLDSVDAADIVIADLPCSGLGVLGKKTDLKYKATEEGIKSLVCLQRQILEQVHLYVRPGGALIYSTCTINREENEENVQWFLEQFPDFSLDSIEDKVCEELKDSITEKGCLQLLPGIHQCDGFFIARFVRGGKQ